MIKAEIIADSLSDQGHRLTTFILEFPRIVLAEFNTHRMLSRNSASSRAIPFQTMLQMVSHNAFIPVKWMQDHKGMQGTKFFDDMTCKEAWSEIDRCFNYEEYSKKPAKQHLTTLWLNARDMAVQCAKNMAELGVSKQIVNRLLEPFMWHKVIVTGTEWENFFALRAHEAAEIHIQELAHKMLEVYNDHQPIKLKGGEWHIPFYEDFKKGEENSKRLSELVRSGIVKDGWEAQIKIATARCARVSYNDFEGKDDYDADIRLHDRLLVAGHMSPFEHCAQVMTEEESWQKYGSYPENPYGNGWCGNFRGFVQYRKTLTNENKTDSRVKK